MVLDLQIFICCSKKLVDRSGGKFAKHSRVGELFSLYIFRLVFVTG